MGKLSANMKWLLFFGLSLVSLSLVAGPGQPLSSQPVTLRQAWSLTNQGPGRLTTPTLWLALVLDIAPYQRARSQSIVPTRLSTLTDQYG
ncbi:MAG TPA: hypothetical protein ENI38_04260, partial [Candidatus Acetothermia bacterium]|nr:hypothetical protein [Candidatus Acetothermia bacterium]